MIVHSPPITAITMHSAQVIPPSALQSPLHCCCLNLFLQPPLTFFSVYITTYPTTNKTPLSTSDHINTPHNILYHTDQHSIYTSTSSVHQQLANKQFQQQTTNSHKLPFVTHTNSFNTSLSLNHPVAPPTPLSTLNLNQFPVHTAPCTRLLHKTHTKPSPASLPYHHLLCLQVQSNTSLTKPCCPSSHSITAAPPTPTTHCYTLQCHSSIPLHHKHSSHQQTSLLTTFIHHFLTAAIKHKPIILQRLPIQPSN